VRVDIDQKSWLFDLVDAHLRAYDPAAALVRLPPELRSSDPDGPGLEARARTLLVRSMRRKLLEAVPTGGTEPSAAEDAFLGPIEGHIGLALDIALVHGAPFDRVRRRAELATLFCALTGSFDDLKTVDPSRPAGAEATAVKRALARAGAALKARHDPAGDPKGGVPLRVGVLGIQRRHLARLAIAYYGESSLDLALARKLYDQATGDAVLLAEALVSLAAATGATGPRRRRIWLAQVARLRFTRELAKKARVAVTSPRPLGELARATPLRLRAFLLEQLLISEFATGSPSPARTAALQSFADESQIPQDQVSALEVEAAEFYAEQQRWLGGTPAPPPDEAELAQNWEGFADEMMDRVATAVTENLEAIVPEMRETGELGQLLAKAAGGHSLTPEERLKVKAQLIDLAKAVPALAIFAAPGGMLLLPLLAKLLPWNVLPSAWDHKDKRSLEGAKGAPPRA
jgi:LETM1-like protein